MKLPEAITLRRLSPAAALIKIKYMAEIGYRQAEMSG